LLSGELTGESFRSKQVTSHEKYLGDLRSVFGHDKRKPYTLVY
jgi:hypothetical protein